MEWKKKIGSTCTKVKNWCAVQWYLHKEEIIIGASIVVPMGIGAIKEVHRSSIKHAEERRKEMFEYDPSTGWYNELNRKLSAEDKEMLLLYKNQTGCTNTEALIHFGLLKK